MDNPNDLRRENDIPICEYCGCELTQENVANEDEVCDYCHEQRIDELVRKADMGILEDMGVVYEV